MGKRKNDKQLTEAEATVRAAWIEAISQVLIALITVGGLSAIILGISIVIYSSVVIGATSSPVGETPNPPTKVTPDSPSTREITPDVPPTMVIEDPCLSMIHRDNTADANIRILPGTVNAVLGSLPAGTPIKVIAKTREGGWFKIVHPELEGWVAASLVETNCVNVPVLDIEVVNETPVPPFQPPPESPQVLPPPPDRQDEPMDNSPGDQGQGSPQKDNDRPVNEPVQPEPVQPELVECTDPNPGRDLKHEQSHLVTDSSGVIVNRSDACSYDVGIASYKMVDGTTDTQILHASDTRTIAPGQALDLSIGLPGCAAQVDLFYGGVITQFKPGTRYGDRLIDGRYVDWENWCKSL